MGIRLDTRKTLGHDFTMAKKRALIVLASAAFIALVSFLIIPSRPGNERAYVEETSPEKSAGETKDGGYRSRGGTVSDLFPLIFSDMDDTGEYRRPHDEPGARTNEMFALIERFAAMEKLPADLLLPSGTSREEIDGHMMKMREMIQYDTLVRDGTATIAQKRRLYELKKELFVNKLHIIEGYREFNQGEEDQKTAEERLGLLRDRIRECEDELRRL